MVKKGLETKVDSFSLKVCHSRIKKTVTDNDAYESANRMNERKIRDLACHIAVQSIIVLAKIDGFFKSANIIFNFIQKN